MERILFEYITDEDRNQSNYAFMRKHIKTINNKVDCVSKYDFVSKLTKIKTNDTSIVITIIAHSYTGNDAEHGIILDAKRDNLIIWRELIDIFNGCRTNHCLIVNLLSCCYSNEITEKITQLDTVDRIWFSNIETASSREAYLLTYKFNGFDTFMDYYINDLYGNENDFGEYKK